MLYNPGMQAANFSIQKFQKSLLCWYGAHARDLPWRHSRQPYAIWVSEVMLQQTRVAAVLEHYARFMNAFPSITGLAEASEEEVLARWSGLGYYRRARQFHHAAQIVSRELSGNLPQTASGLRKLPGIGEYTAAAIASIAFGEPAAVIDGNVERVIDRLFLSPKTARRAWTKQRAEALLDRNEPGTFNQAMMELGATICVPRKPLCLTCPVQVFCSTRGELRPRRSKQLRSRSITYALLTRRFTGRTYVMLEQRPSNAAQMPGMWELPEASQMTGPDSAREVEQVALALRHAITVTNYSVKVIRVPERRGAPALMNFERSRRWIETRELGSLPLTGLARKILLRLEFMQLPQEVETRGPRSLTNVL